MERVVGLTYYLYIPQSIEDEIKLKFTDEMEQKKQAIRYWINTDPLAGWRRLITALDEMRETQLADLIRSNAEPITGMCIEYIYACMYVIHGLEITNIHAGHSYTCLCTLQE